MSIPYPLKEIDSYYYEFTTDNNVEYKVYFIYYRDMFDGYEHITCPVYSFNIDIISGKSIVSDARIKATVLYIIDLFFKAVDNVAIYVCDSSDERHLARKRKFDMWFSSYSNDTIIKEDCKGAICGSEIYSTLLIHKENYQLNYIIAAFKELNEYDV